ncbi:MAG TPA: hypothetical protein VL854_13190 [Nitrososphaeraceae archaeon]|nr:hypothetical protein [Nitrososphaeraceae archaeon]
MNMTNKLQIRKTIIETGEKSDLDADFAIAIVHNLNILNIGNILRNQYFSRTMIK